MMRPGLHQVLPNSEESVSTEICLSGSFNLFFFFLPYMISCGKGLPLKGKMCELEF